MGEALVQPYLVVKVIDVTRVLLDRSRVVCGLESAKFLLSVHDQGCHGELSYLGGVGMKFFRQAKDFTKLAGLSRASAAF